MRLNMGIFDALFKKKKQEAGPSKPPIALSLALSEIETFRTGRSFVISDTSQRESLLTRLESEYSRKLPLFLLEYLTQSAPIESAYLDDVGNPICLFATTDLKYKQDGYNFDPRSQQAIEGWPEQYFIVADRGGDPIAVDLTSLTGSVWILEHGEGDWENRRQIADSVGQFLLCVFAQHHALNEFERPAIIDDAKGFNLSPLAAAWYFPRMQEWAGKHYKEWCHIFDDH